MVEIKHATDATFEELVLKAERPVVVDFWAAWCGPCKMVAPEMEKLAEKYEGSVDVVKVDVDANPRLSQAFNIMSIPTIAFFKPGKQPQGVVGFRPLEQLEQQFGLAEFSASSTPLRPRRTPARADRSARQEQTKPDRQQSGFRPGASSSAALSAPPPASARARTRTSPDRARTGPTVPDRTSPSPGLAPSAGRRPASAAAAMGLEQKAAGAAVHRGEHDPTHGVLRHAERRANLHLGDRRRQRRREAAND